MRSDDLGRARGAAYAVLALAMQLSLAHVARAELPEGCTELGLGLTEHTCFHARFGPFVEATANA